MQAFGFSVKAEESVVVVTQVDRNRHAINHCQSTFVRILGVQPPENQSRTYRKVPAAPRQRKSVNASLSAALRAWSEGSLPLKVISSLLIFHFSPFLFSLFFFFFFSSSSFKVLCFSIISQNCILNC